MTVDIAQPPNDLSGGCSTSVPFTLLQLNGMKELMRDDCGMMISHEDLLISVMSLYLDAMDHLDLS